MRRVLLCVAGFTLACAVRQPALEPVRGVESPELLDEVRGVLAVTTPLQGITLHVFPDRGTVLLPARGFVGSISGPNDGTVLAAAMEDERGQAHRLVVFTADGGTAELLQRPGGILWHRSISGIALRDDGAIAFVSKPEENRNDFKPLVSGPLEVWDPATKATRLVGVQAGGERPAWLSGSRLLFAEARPPFPPSMATEDEPPPMLRIIDLSTGAVTDLTTGFEPVVSSDARTVLVRLSRRSAGGVALIDVESRAVTPVEPPGLYGAPIALVGRRYVVYWARPTAGSPEGWTKGNSPLVGAKPMRSIKLADLATGRFVTLLPLVDPRDRVSGTFTAAR